MNKIIQDSKIEVSFRSTISEDIWDDKYRFELETLSGTWTRISKALSKADKKHEKSFFEALSDFGFLPAGRILAGAGTDRSVTLFNCFVMGTVPDDMAGIFEMLKEAALTMQQGGGIGYDFSTIRPKGAAVKGVAADASGPLSFMDVWDAMCRTIMSAGSRRGAMMATMRCDHPDVEDFIIAKQDAARLRMFNLSVLITDPFMEAVKADTSWDLVFDGKVYKTVRALDLWNKIMKSTYDFAEPGVIFIDRINAKNNLNYIEKIAATNPCGEQPLPPYGACLLGSINLAQFILNAFEKDASMDEAGLAKRVRVAVRMLDNVIDQSNFPLPEQEHEAQSKRRIGLGVTGLADALIFLGQTYGSDEAAATAENWMRIIAREAYIASALLAKEKGAFPLFDSEKFLNSDMMTQMDDEVRDLVSKHGIRNALLTSIAPTGTISLYAGNVSSGIEPVFAYKYVRKILEKDGSQREEDVQDYAYSFFRNKFGNNAELPDSFVSAQTLLPEAHLKMQAAVQKWIDSSISKTINCPEDISFNDFKNIYEQAWDMGCKGCTTYRPNDVTGSVLSISSGDGAEPALLAPRLADEPMERDQSLSGNTYKLKWPESDHALYITINNIVVDEREIPFEIFVNSKNMEHYAWTLALTRMISAVFRRGGDVSFVVEELKAVFDPRGGAWVQGKYIPSILAAIGGVIEEHLEIIGYADVILSRPKNIKSSKKCPRCSVGDLVASGGCDVCNACGHSKCQ